MAKVFISEIQPDQDIASQFVVADKQLRVARNGNPFLTLKLVDKTGEITGRIWDRAGEVAETVSTKGVVFLKGRSEKFREELQLQVREISLVPVSQVDPADFLPVCPIPVEVLFESLKKIASQVKRRPLLRLIRQILNDPELMELFKKAPAAKNMHHAYLGGLLEHTVSVAQLAIRLNDHFGEYYPELDKDLLIMGAILHDIGKVHEFVYDLCIDYSDAGRMLGHMILGVEILEEKIRNIKNFPEKEALLLKHMILSHHGTAEFGAVKLPVTREAFLLHFADDLDAKMNSLTRILSEAKENSSWTSYQPLFDRFFFRGFSSDPEPERNEFPEMRYPEEGAVQLSIWRTGRKKETDE